MLYNVLHINPYLCSLLCTFSHSLDIALCEGFALYCFQLRHTLPKDYRDIRRLALAIHTSKRTVFSMYDSCRYYTSGFILAVQYYKQL